MVRKISGLPACVLLIWALSGCAGLPGNGNSNAALRSTEAEAKVVEANRELDSVNEQSAVFYAQLASVLQEIKELRRQPGWNEFEHILSEYPSLKDPDNEMEVSGEIKSRLSEWSGKWGTPWEQILEGYRRLVDKCIILEAKKLAVRERLLAVQARYISAAMLEISAGREKEGTEVYSIVEMLDKPNMELNSYQPDDFGLYGAGTGNH
jgi:hypothetical protein